MNLTLSLLSLYNSSDASPMVLVGLNTASNSFHCANAKLVHSLGSFALSIGLGSLDFSGSRFEHFLSQVFAVDTQLVTHSKQMDLTGEFTISIEYSSFTNIKAREYPGAAFYAVSEFHLLELKDSIFNNCYADVSAPFTKNRRNVAAGAFLFIGSLAKILRICVFLCSANGNAQTFYVATNYKGESSNGHMIISSNGGYNIKGHSLFIMDIGNNFLSGCNNTDNVVPDGYAGGYMGWFAYNSQLEYSHIFRCTGDTIYGSSAERPSEAPIVLFTELRNNTAKESLLVLLPPGLVLNSVLLMNNKCKLFSGFAPLTCHSVYADHPIQGDTWYEEIEWNFDTGLTFKLSIPDKCPE